MSKYGKKFGKGERFVLLRHLLTDSPAWQSLTGNARALYFEMARRYNGSNNGIIPYSIQEAVESLHIGPATACNLFRVLESRGFIVCTKKGAFSLKTVKEASLWLLTEHASDHPVAHATKTFMRWQMPEGETFASINGRPESKTRYPTRKRTSRPESKTRLLTRNRTASDTEPHGFSHGTVSSKKGLYGFSHGTVKAKNGTSTASDTEHLYVPGGSGVVAGSSGVGDGVVRSCGVCDGVGGVCCQRPVNGIGGKKSRALESPPWEGDPVWASPLTEAELDRPARRGR